MIHLPTLGNNPGIASSHRPAHMTETAMKNLLVFETGSQYSPGWL